MTSLLTKTDLPASIANRELTDAERYDYATHKFGMNMIWLRRTRSGRILIGNQARDAIGVVESWEELMHVLTIAQARNVTWADVEERKRVRKLEEEKQTNNTMKSLLDEIDI